MKKRLDEINPRTKRKFVKNMEKPCVYCKQVFKIPFGLSSAQFEKRFYCTKRCQILAGSAVFTCYNPSCGKEFRTGKNSNKKYCCQTCVYSNRPQRSGTYHTVHKWISKRYGKAAKCENPDCLGTSKTFHWSLLRGKEYEKKRENFWQLCVKCHRNYDKTEEDAKRMAIAKSNPVNQFTLQGELVKTWHGALKIEKELGIPVWHIYQCCLGRKENYAGSIWKYSDSCLVCSNTGLRKGPRSFEFKMMNCSCHYGKALSSISLQLTEQHHES